MNFKKAKSEIEKYSATLRNIEEKEIDDIKDVEMYESFIREMIFDYCVTKKYEVKGFPFLHLKRVENREPGYDEDYLTWERMEHYIQQLALEKEDVFELCFIDYQHYYDGLDREGVRNMIEELVAMAEGENLSFDLTKEEIEEATREEKPYRPKLP